MIIQRKKYLDSLISGQGNNLVKIVTGVRRCGKSFYLLQFLISLKENFLVYSSIVKFTPPNANVESDIPVNTIVCPVPAA